MENEDEICQFNFPFSKKKKNHKCLKLKESAKIF